MKLRSALDRDVVCGIIALAIALLYLHAAGSISDTALADSMGAAGVPHILGYALVVTSLVLIANRIFDLSFATTPADKPEPRGVFDRPLAAFMMAAVASGICIAAALLFERAGYAISMMLLIFSLSIYQGIRDIRRLILISILGGAVLWLIFAILLNVRMPVGTWLGS